MDTGEDIDEDFNIDEELVELKDKIEEYDDMDEQIPNEHFFRETN